MPRPSRSAGVVISLYQPFGVLLVRVVGRKSLASLPRSLILPTLPYQTTPLMAIQTPVSDCTLGPCRGTDTRFPNCMQTMQSEPTTNLDGQRSKKLHCHAQISSLAPTQATSYIRSASSTDQRQGMKETGLGLQTLWPQSRQQNTPASHG